MPDQKLLTVAEIQAIAKAAAEKIVDRQTDPTKRYLPDTVCPSCGAVEYLALGDDSTWAQEAEDEDDIGSREIIQRRIADATNQFEEQ